MNIQIRLRGLEEERGLRKQILRRVQLHLGRYSAAVSSAYVRLEDVNGPKGGVDKRCRITVAGPRLGAVAVEHQHVEVYGALDLALDRASRATLRAIERYRDVHSPATAPLRRAS